MYQFSYYLVVNIPKPSELLVRLFILAGYPLRGRKRGEHVLTCMKALCPNLKEELVELWDMVLPKLLSYLQGNVLVVTICTGAPYAMYI